MSAGKALLRSGRPLWLGDSGRLEQRYPSLSGQHDTTVAVVGGGMTGALVAHAFASAGIATTVVEAELIGTGSTAASSALLLKEPDRELTQLAMRYGARASRMWELSHQSVNQLVALLRRLRIRCGLKSQDAVYYALAAQAARRLCQEYDRRARSGFHAEWLGPGALRRLTGIAGHGAILSKGGAQFDPYRACAGIFRRASSAGAQVFERSHVRRIEQDRHGVRIRTRQGTLRAERVVIATGYATPQFRPLTGRFRMYRTYVLATEPIDRVHREDIGLADVMVWDTERPYHYARWTADHRLLLGGEDRPIQPGQRRRQQSMAATHDLREYFEDRLPALASVRTEYAWEGLFAMTADSLPYIGPHRRYPRHWFALGYGGNGMTFSFLAARQLLERWQGVKSRDHGLFEFDRLRKRR